MEHKLLSFIHELTLGVKPSKQFTTATVIYLYLLVIGTIFYSVNEHWSILDSFYFSAITLATEGYGDLHPTNPVSKIFTVFYVYIGVGLVVFVLSNVAKHLMEGREKRIKQLEELLKQDLEKKS